MKNAKVGFILPDYKDLICYGKIESDHEYRSVAGIKRIRNIRYMGILYYLSMINGRVEILVSIDRKE